MLESFAADSLDKRLERVPLEFRGGHDRPAQEQR
jgi:hypothetical protein